MPSRYHPGNILIRSYDPPEALLSDVGCASDQTEILYDWPGTIPYLAPEQWEGLLHGPAVDYWACGLVDYELLTREVTQSRVDPGPVLECYHEALEKRGSVIAECCMNMLNTEPATRMTAREAAKMLFLQFAVEKQREEEALDDMSMLNSKRTKIR